MHGEVGKCTEVVLKIHMHLNFWSLLYHNVLSNVTNSDDTLSSPTLPPLSTPATVKKYSAPWVSSNTVMLVMLADVL